MGDTTCGGEPFDAHRFIADDRGWLPGLNEAEVMARAWDAAAHNKISFGDLKPTRTRRFLRGAAQVVLPALAVAILWKIAGRTGRGGNA